MKKITLLSMLISPYLFSVSCSPPQIAQIYEKKVEISSTPTPTQVSSNSNTTPTATPTPSNNIITTPDIKLTPTPSTTPSSIIIPTPSNSSNIIIPTPTTTPTILSSNSSGGCCLGTTNNTGSVNIDINLEQPKGSGTINVTFQPVTKPTTTP